MKKSRVKFDDSKLQAILKKVTTDKAKGVRIGILGSGQAREDGLTNAEVGSIHEFGSFSKGIEKRSFLKDTITIKKKEIRHAIVGEIKDVSVGKKTKTLALARIGLVIEGFVIDSFNTGGFGKWAKLSLKTIAQKTKNSTKILVDTSSLKNSITSKVIK